MRVFIVSLTALVVIAGGAGAVFTKFAEPAAVAFSTSEVRL
jgi:hypothetical protein